MRTDKQTDKQTVRRTYLPKLKILASNIHRVNNFCISNGLHERFYHVANWATLYQHLPTDYFSEGFEKGVDLDKWRSASMSRFIGNRLFVQQLFQANIESTPWVALCLRNPPVTDGSPSQGIDNAERGVCQDVIMITNTFDGMGLVTGLHHL